MRLLQAPDPTVLASFLNRIRGEQASLRSAKCAKYNFDFDQDAPWPKSGKAEGQHVPTKNRFIWERINIENYTPSLIAKKENSQNEEIQLEKPENNQDEELEGSTTPPSEEDPIKEGKKRACSITQASDCSENLKRHKDE